MKLKIVKKDGSIEEIVSKEEERLSSKRYARWYSPKSFSTGYFNPPKGKDYVYGLDWISETESKKNV